MVARDQIEVRLKSSRAPYTRGGIKFGSNRDLVVLSGDQITDAQLLRLSEDPAISIEVVNPATGEAVQLIKTDDQAEPGAADAGGNNTPPVATAPAPAPAPAAASAKPKPARKPRATKARAATATSTEAPVR
ncbi:MAG: hypothetical protein DCF29_09570 [Alphaproteobacteria bacterium]|nr:MAG: hypothetical protein DCF29_09570 [Alphaproteobacteria bacterium]